MLHTKALHIATTTAAMAALVTMGFPAPAMAAAPATCNVASVVAGALPAIVNITVIKVLGPNAKDEGTPLDAESMAPAANRAPPDAGANAGRPHFETFVGSGSIINPAGIIVTNRHVIKDAAEIKVTFNDKTQVPAQLIAAASLMDLAVLKVNMPEPLPTLRFDNSDDLKIGQTVMAVGNPLGLGTSVSVGVVSGRDRNIMRTPFDDFIQTDAAINPGNSGGPLLDCSGGIAGVDTALLSNSKVLGSIGIGFALPANDARFVASKLLYPQTDKPNWIGVHLQNLTTRLATIFARPNMHGAIITAVDPNSPAAAAQLQPGDIIAGADGRELDSASAILRFVVTQESGKPISLLVWRHDEMDEVVLVGRPWPHMQALRSGVLASPAAVAAAQAAGLGLQLAPLTPADRARYKLGDVSGVLVDRVTPGSQADDLGVRPGDVIERVNDQPAQTPDEVMHQLMQGATADGDLVALLLHSKTETRWISLYVGRLYVANLLATPTVPNGFGPASDVAVGPP